MVHAGDDQREELGFTLAHEFGHYAYSMGDEYSRSPDLTSAQQPIALMSSAQLAGSIGSAQPDLQWLNFSTP
jgi:hypothetical protein